MKPSRFLKRLFHIVPSPCTLATALAILLTAVPNHRAQCSEPGSWDGIGKGLAVTGIVILAASTIPAIGNTVNVCQKTEPSLGWVVAGFVVGGIGLIGGAASIYDDHKFWIPWAILATGVLNTGAAALNLALPRAPKPLPVTAFVSRDGKHPVGGLALYWGF